MNTTTPTIDELQIRQEDLALAVLEGQPGANSELDAVKRQIRERETRQTDAALAEQARTRRTAAEEHARRQQAIRELETMWDRLVAAEAEALVIANARRTSEAIEAFVSAARSRSSLASELAELVPTAPGASCSRYVGKHFAPGKHLDEGLARLSVSLSGGPMRPKPSFPRPWLALLAIARGEG